MKLTISKSREVFRSYLRDSGYKEKTIVVKMSYLKVFFQYIRECTEISDLREIKEDVVNSFFRYLEILKSDKTNKPYSKRYKTNLFSCIKLFFKALYVKEKLLFSPLRNIEYEPSGNIDTKSIFTEKEISLFLDSIQGSSYLLRRDRTMFELMYSSGLRPGEVVNVKLSDINFKESLLLIRQGKFGKDRIVPVSVTAMAFLKKFTNKSRSDNYIFRSTQRHGKLEPSAFNRRFKKHLETAGIEKEGLTSHSIRHSTATHLLNRGADINYVQSLLGHESVETTVVYTHLLSDKLKRTYKSHHPRENEYFEEVDPKYLKDISKLEESIMKLRRNLSLHHK